MQGAVDLAVVFFAMERALAAILPRGKRRCWRAMRKADRAFNEPDPRTAPMYPDPDNAARLMLRRHCAVCPTRCKHPLK